MVFNNEHLCEYFIVSDIRRHILPPQEIMLKRIPAKRGARFVRKKHGVGVIEVDITVIDHEATDFRAKIRHIASLLDTKKPEKLIFTDEPDKYYLAILDGDTNLDEIMMIGEGTLKFICPDPIAYGDLVTVNIANNVTIYNNGTHPAKGKITIVLTDSVDYLQVTLLNTGEFLYINDDFSPGDVVVIDLEAEYVTKNGYSSMTELFLESDFFSLPVGEFELVVSSGNVVLEYRERWL